MPSISPTMSFDEASEAVLAFLEQRLPWGLWSVTRLVNGTRTVLTTRASDYPERHGDEYPWADAFCVKMLSGEAPHIAPDVAKVPALAGQPVAGLAEVGAYAGAPISDVDGTLFGTLCGLNRTAVDEEVVREAPLIELLAQLLGVVLTADRDRDELARNEQRARLEADTDALTGVTSRRGWDGLLAAEEQHQHRFADPVVVVVVDLDGLKDVNDTRGHAAGDAYLQRAAATLASAVREQDPVARLGGDEFAVLLRGTSAAEAPGRVRHLRAAFEDARVEASIGWAAHSLGSGFAGAVAAADAAMYRDKAERKARRREALAG